MPRTPWLALFASLALTTPTLHAEERNPIRVTYSAPSTCPFGEELVRQLLARSDRLRLARGDESSRELVFNVEAVEEGYHGAFALSVGTGTTDRREIVAENCAEVVHALGLIAALALDPEARLELEASPVPETSTGATPFPPPEEAQRLPAEPARRPPPEPAVVEAPGQSKPPTLTVAAGFRLELATGLGPPLAPMPRALLGLGLPRGVTLTLAAGAAQSEVQTDLGATAFRLVAARLELCAPVVGHAAQLAPCAGLDVGGLRAHPSKSNQLDSMRTDERLWMAPLAGLRFRWAPAQKRSRTHFELETWIASIWPTGRGDYYFSSEGQKVKVHRVPPVAGVLGVGLGLRFRDR